MRPLPDIALRSSRWQSRQIGLFAASLAVAAVASSPHARAASSESPSDAAKEKYGRALKAYSANRHAEAVLLLEDVRRLHSSPSALLLLGHCYSKLGRLASAISAYRESERSAVEQMAKDRDRSSSLKEIRGSALEHMADLESRVPYLTIIIPGDLPPDFQILLDGQAVPSASWGTALPVDPGGHELAAKGTRMIAYKQSVILKESEKKRIELSIERESSARAAVLLPERVELSTVSLTVDGQSQAIRDRMINLYLAPGQHSLTVQASNRRTFRYRGEFVAEDKLTLRPPLTRTPPRWLTFAIAGLTLGALGTAVALGGYAQARHSQEALIAADPNSPQKADQVTVRSSIQQYASACNSLLVVSGVLALGTAGVAAASDWSWVRR
jgi:cytochrome c-type biogenesis protein CcmH/NrfG